MGLDGLLDSSKPPSAAPPLTDVAPLHESGVVGLARVASPFFLRTFCLERRWRTLHSSWRTGAAPFLRGARRGAGRGSAWWRRNSISTTMESSDMAVLTHSSSSVMLMLLYLLCWLLALFVLCGKWKRKWKMREKMWEREREKIVVWGNKWRGFICGVMEREKGDALLTSFFLFSFSDFSLILRIEFGNFIKLLLIFIVNIY